MLLPSLSERRIVTLMKCGRLVRNLVAQSCSRLLSTVDILNRPATGEGYKPTSTSASQQVVARRMYNAAALNGLRVALDLRVGCGSEVLVVRELLACTR